MEKIIVLVAATVFSGIGWWFGELVAGMFTAFMLSIIGTAVGVYAGRWFVRTYLP